MGVSVFVGTHMSHLHECLPWFPYQRDVGEPCVFDNSNAPRSPRNKITLTVGIPFRRDEPHLLVCASSFPTPLSKLPSQGQLVSNA